MKVALREIQGPWDRGWVLDKHTLKSTYLGTNESGRAQFENIRSEVGEATFLLKYRQQWDKAQILAEALAEHICPRFDQIGFIVPMPASTQRGRQPVNEVACALSSILKIPAFDHILVKAANGQSLKDLTTKDEKLAAIAGTLSIKDRITNSGRWNVLLLDDLYDSGASMRSVSMTLRHICL